MGARGRPKQPTALTVLKGGKASTSEPLPGLVEVLPPARVVADPVAMAEWDRLAPDLIEKGVLTFWDVEAFADYCWAVALVVDAGRHLADEGHVIEAPVFDHHGQRTGSRRARNEWSRVQKDALEVKARRSARFGLTPADRAGISIAAPVGGGPRDPGRLLS